MDGTDLLAAGGFRSSMRHLLYRRRCSAASDITTRIKGYHHELSGDRSKVGQVDDLPWVAHNARYILLLALQSARLGSNPPSRKLSGIRRFRLPVCALNVLLLQLYGTSS